MPEGWELVASSRFARVVFHRERQIYYKEFLPRGPLETIKGWAKGSRATRARRNSEALVAAGIAAPVNLAWGRLPGGREYLFTGAAGGEGVTRWLRSRLTGRSGADLRTRRRLLRELGRFIGKVHATGFIHGDLRTSNVLAELEGEDFHFTLIDNERNSRSQPAPGKGLLRNLMQLNMLPPADLSQRDRMRFFCEWRKEMNELNDIEAKVLGADAYQWAMRRLHEKGKL